MKTRLLMAPLLALVTLAARQPRAHADDTKPTPTPHTRLRLRGIVKKYDAATRLLWLTTADGAVQILVAPAVRIRHGWTEIDAGELEKLAGELAAVRPSDAVRHRITVSIAAYVRTARTER
jgi:hypothetical protein